MSGFSPISFAFIASGIAIQAKALLYRMKPSRADQSQPSWLGNGEEFTTRDVSIPITDASYWQDRYALTKIYVEKEDRERLLINDATVTISRKKEIVTTPMVGLDGTIKEYINMSDYDIRVSVGIVATQNGKIIDEYPYDGIEKVRSYLEINKRLRVNSLFLDIFDIGHMVVTDFSLNQDTASNRQVIEFRALSDKDYNIYSEEY